MKNKLSVVIILFVAAICVAGYLGVVCVAEKAATQQDLEQAKKELKAQIDSVLRNQDSIKAARSKPVRKSSSRP